MILAPINAAAIRLRILKALAPPLTPTQKTVTFD